MKVMAGFGPLSGQTWPHDPSIRVRLEKWCRTQPKSTQETNSNVISLHCLLHHQNSNLKSVQNRYFVKLGTYRTSGRMLWGCVFEVWPAPGAREGLQKGGARSPPHLFMAFPGPRGWPDLKKEPHKSGLTAFKYRESWVLLVLDMV